METPRPSRARRFSPPTPSDLDALAKPLLRKIVLFEASRQTTKDAGDTAAEPAVIAHIRKRGLLSAEEIEHLVTLAPRLLARRKRLRKVYSLAGLKGQRHATTLSPLTLEHAPLKESMWERLVVFPAISHSQETRMNSDPGPYVQVLRAALTERSSIITAAFNEASRSLPMGTHVRALGRLTLTVREIWLRAWVRQIREKANDLQRIEFALASASGGDHPSTTAVCEIVLVSQQGESLTLPAESAEWLTGPEAADAPNPELMRLRQITGLRWSPAKSLQNFAIELHELCLTLYSTALCERAVRHLGQPLLWKGNSSPLQPAAGASSPRHILLLR